MARLRRPLELTLPRPPRWSLLAAAISVAVHALLLFGWIEGRLPFVPPPPSERLVYLPPSSGPITVELPPVAPARGRGDRAALRHGAATARRRTIGRVAEAPADTAQRVVATPAPRPAPDTAAAPAKAAPGRLSGPGMGAGKLWVSPLPLPPRELAERLTRKSHVQLVDSAVTAVVQAFLDSIAQEPGADRVALPSWTRQIAGKTFGLDSHNIYIAGLKIPAVVLGLLPLHGGGNIDQNHAYQHLQDLRDDLMRAAQQSQTKDDFKEAVRELRAEKEREHQADRNQRLPADSVYATPRDPKP